MAGGQDLDLCGGAEPDIAELEHAYRTKTGGLFRAAALAPACIVQELPDSRRHSLEVYADALGLAFQIRDDLADLGSDTPLGPAAETSRLPSWVQRFGEQAARERIAELAQVMDASCRDFTGPTHGFAPADRLDTRGGATATMRQGSRERQHRIRGPCTSNFTA